MSKKTIVDEREFIEHLTTRSLKKKGHGRGLRVENLIGSDNGKCHNILSKYIRLKGRFLKLPIWLFVFDSVHVCNSI